MTKLGSRIVAVVLTASIASAFSGPVAGAPTRPATVQRPMLLVAPRSFGVTRSSGAPFVHRTLVPLTSLVRSAPMPALRALPLPGPPPANKFAPALLLPRLAFAALLPVAPTLGACPRGRSPLQIAALPKTPFASPACRYDAWRPDDFGQFPTLTAGQNKNALYGPAYAPHDFAAP